nr:uncharacterized protein C1orf101 homolog isoform X4 [Pogona vitticeps]
MAGSLFPLVPSVSLLLCLWLSGCWAGWRYRTRIGSYILFTTRTTIYLEYEGTSFVQWDIPILCSVEDKSSPQTTMICSVAGTHRIMPGVRTPTFEDKERYLTVNVDLNCFLWYDYSIQSSMNTTHHNLAKDLIVWIYDPENADSSEVKKIASKPPAYSRALSKQFSNLGQVPTMKTYFRGIEFTEAQFMDEGFWKIAVNPGLDDIIAHIHGKTITFHGCFVAPSPVVIPETESPVPDVYDISISSPVGSDVMVIWAACFPTTAVLLTDIGVFRTSNGFQTSEEIKFPSTVLDRAMAQHVYDAAIVFHYYFFLIEDAVYVANSSNFYRVGEDKGFPENGVIGIRSRTWCESIYPESETILTALLVWTENVIYFIAASHDRPFSVLQVMDVETLKKTVGFRKNVDLTIINACYDSVPSEVSILLACVRCSSTRTFYLVAYDEERSVWSLRDFSLPVPTVKVMEIEVISSARSAMLLWDSDKVYYTYKANRVNGYMMEAGTDKILSAASEGTSIHQIIIDFDGNTVIKMKNNIMFFLKFNMKDVIRLNAWEKESKTYILYVNPLSDLYLLTINDSNIVRQTYPLKTEIFSATHALNEVCPYISFQHSVKLNVYYVDKGENVTFWTQIVFLENLGLSTEVTMYRAHLLKRKSNLQYEIARGICTKNETTVLYHNHDYSKDQNYEEAIIFSEGVMTIDLRPSETGRTCISNNKQFFIVIGCSPTRHIDVEKPSSCKKENFIVNIPAESLWTKTDGKGLEVEYNMEKFGCPIEAYYADPFRPTVVLYDRETPVRTVQANYILWEVNNRKDFNYNSTMEQVQCLREAQSWFSMGSKKTENMTNVWIDEFWGPQNYKSCFEVEHGNLGDLDEPYEILNHSGINSIIWPQYHTGIYMFKLKIVDPNFSFCDFEIFFAVRTYGVIKRPNIAKIIGWSAFIVILFLGTLVFSYFRYRTNTGDYFIFSTRTTIYLEYEGTAFLEWDVPLLCIIDDKNLPQTTLNCPVPGTHRIAPIVKPPSAAEMERFLSVKADVNCFMWYIYQDTSGLTHANPKQSIKLWIFDPENADESEWNYTATSPSVYSKTLSKQFWNLGETPLVKTVSGGRKYHEKEFNDGIWTIEVPTLTNDNIAEIHGKTFTFQDCFVLATPFVIAQPVFHLGFETDTSISSPAGSPAIVTWDACYPATAVLVTDFGTFYTNDGFLTMEEIRFPAHIIDSALIHSVKDVAVMFPDVFILIEDKLYKATEEDIYSIGDVYNVPNTGVKGVQTKTWCSNEYPLIDRLLSEVIIWTDDELIIGFPNDQYSPLTDTSLLKEQLQLQRATDLLLISACYDSLTAIIAVLIECIGCITTKILLLAAYNEGTTEWNLRDFSLTSSISGDIHMEVITSAVTSMVLWDDDKVFYTYKENKDYGFLQVSGTDKTFSAASEGSTIHQLIIDYNGNTIIKMKNNVIFFFKFEMGDTVKLAPWEEEKTHFIFYCNPSGDMYLLTIDGRDIKRQIYPLKLEAFSAAWKLDETFRFYHKQDYSRLLDYEASIRLSQGIMTVELHPSLSGKTCDLKFKLTHLRVGCPPGKILHVLGKPSECDDFKFTVPWKSLRNKTIQEDLEIDYDLQTYGCPIDVHYADIFRPTIGLYIDNEFLSIVDANYVLWEMNGRNDFGYNATMEQVRCVNRAQSWNSMIYSYGINETSSITPEEADMIWGPHNYASCFATITEDLSDLDNPYEILNHSGINSITWPQYNTGIYMFRLKIVDPNFSFCNFFALFGVRTYGIIERPNWLVVAGWSTMLVTLFLGVLVFSYFRYVKTFRTLNFVDPILTPSPRASVIQPTDGLKKE